MNSIISIVLDKRRIKENGTFPVKLRVFSKSLKKDKRYPLDIDLTADKFEAIWINPENKSLRGTNKEIRLKLQAIETRANNEARELTIFDFGKFETKFFRKSSDKNNLKYHFDLVIQKNLNNNKVSTAESFRSTIKSLAIFSETKMNCKVDNLTFNVITIDWLKQYQDFMLANNKSYTTVAIYTRTLRVVFNNAIESSDISKDIYPFGKNKYKIPRTKKVKKSFKF